MSAIVAVYVAAAVAGALGLCALGAELWIRRRARALRRRRRAELEDLLLGQEDAFVNY